MTTTVKTCSEFMARARIGGWQPRPSGREILSYCENRPLMWEAFSQREGSHSKQPGDISPKPTRHPTTQGDRE